MVDEKNVYSEIKKTIERIYGDTSDLSEEIVNSICNIDYFLCTGAENGAADLARIHPSKTEGELMHLWLSHMGHVSAISPILPSLIKSLRESKTQSSEVYDYLEKLTLDIIKYKIDDAAEKSPMKRFISRKLATVTEFKGLAKRIGLPYIGNARPTPQNPPLPSAPHITNARPIYRYSFPPYTGVLFDSVESQGPIQFVYAMMIYNLHSGKTPILYITSELNSLTSELLNFLPQQNNSNPEPFLGIYDSHGRANLGSNQDHAILDRFEQTAISLVKSKLSIQGNIQREPFPKNG